ncbi:MAG TPA: hypothetical protein VGL46_14110, partial [Pseudonocardiaceae bacterium]
MTTVLSAPQALRLVAGLSAGAEDAEKAELAALHGAFSEPFWAAAGWDPALRLIEAPPDHPALGWPRCVVPKCHVWAAGQRGTMCGGCRTRHARSGMSIEQFLAEQQTRSEPRAKLRRIFDETCLVPGCPRPQVAATHQLCNTHKTRAYERFGTVNTDTVARLIAQPDIGPLPPYGDCRVLACTRLAEGSHGLCWSHRSRWKSSVAASAGDLEAWCRVEPGIARSGLVNLRGLPELVVMQLLVAVQRRAERSFKIHPEMLELVVRHVR